MIDLHTHSIYSDGEETPAEILQKCKQIGVDIIALTDHDTVDGIKEGREKALEIGIEFVGGIEISSQHLDNEIHIIGLFIDEDNEELIKYCQSAREIRENCGRQIMQKLRNFGVCITNHEEDIACHSRAMIGKLLVEKKVVKTIKEAFSTYLSNGSLAFVEKERISCQDAIDLIHKSGGIAILAHLSTISSDYITLEKIVLDLKDMGIDGIEGFYNNYSPEFSAFVLDLAKRENLAVSGGSDYHGKNKVGLYLGRGYGTLNIVKDVFYNLKNKVTKHN